MLDKCQAYGVIKRGYKAIGIFNEDCREHVAFLYMTLVYLSMVQDYPRELDLKNCLIPNPYDTTLCQNTPGRAFKI